MMMDMVATNKVPITTALCFTRKDALCPPVTSPFLPTSFHSSLKKLGFLVITQKLFFLLLLCRFHILML